MKILEKIIEALEKTDVFTHNHSKIVAIGNTKAAFDLIDEERKDLDLIRGLLYHKYANTQIEVLLSLDDVKIFKFTNPKDDFDINAPYRVIYQISDEKWVSSMYASSTFRQAYLLYLEVINNEAGFAHFAEKMLTQNA